MLKVNINSNGSLDRKAEIQLYKFYVAEVFLGIISLIGSTALILFLAMSTFSFSSSPSEISFPILLTILVVDFILGLACLILGIIGLKKTRSRPTLILGIIISIVTAVTALPSILLIAFTVLTIRVIG